MTDTRYFLKSAQKYLAEGKIRQAIGEYTKLLKENPNDWNLMILIGDLYLKINHKQQAIHFFHEVAEHYYEEGSLNKSLTLYKRIGKLDPELVDVQMRIADLYCLSGQINQARSELQEAVELYRVQSQTVQMSQLLNKLVDIESENPVRLSELAHAYEKDPAIARINVIYAYSCLANLYVSKSHFQEASICLQKLLELEPGNERHRHELEFIRSITDALPATLHTESLNCSDTCSGSPC